MAGRADVPSLPSTERCLYLVTDSTPQILKGRDLVSVVSEALRGGVNLVQYRDKKSETSELIKNGRRLHDVCTQHNVPLLINDRVDVALAIGCEGVHIGQDDMDYATARRILGPQAIIGLTVNNVEEAEAAGRQFLMDNSPKYLGIGTVFPTATKQNTKSIIGPEGVKRILDAYLGVNLNPIFTVAIGGINASNVQDILLKSRTFTKALDGVAVVSDIMAAESPTAAASDLKHQLHRAHMNPSTSFSQHDIPNLLTLIPRLVSCIASASPLNHNMTNLVVQNFAANTATAIGASPIMSNNGDEAADLASHQGSLVINMGTSTAKGLRNYEAAISAYSAANRPILLDPVGCGATAIRRNAVERLMTEGRFAVIKGNEAEIKHLWNPTADARQKGVDSSCTSTSPTDKANIVRKLAARERTVVLMTGPMDFLSDGTHSLVISNGHPYLSAITGSGCVLGTIIAAYLAVEDFRLLAALAGVLMYEIAAERAAVREDVKGPGTFVPALLDELYLIRKEVGDGKGPRAGEWLEAAKVKVV